jgi:hypothetical protein
VERVKSLGNAVVPACAQAIGEAIIEAEKEAKTSETGEVHIERLPSR